MTVNKLDLSLDIFLGILGSIILAIFFKKTKNYLTFQISYYYYLVASPLFWIGSFIEILFSPETSCISPLDGMPPNDSKITADKYSQISDLFQLLLLSLPNILPIVLELIVGAILIIIKYAIIKRISIDDLYLIHYMPLIISIMPLYITKLYSYIPIEAEIYIYNPYNFIGIILNTLFLIAGGLLGLSTLQWLVLT